MQDLSIVLARCLDKSEELGCSPDDIVEANPALSDELKSLLAIAARVQRARHDAEISAETRARLRHTFYRQLK